MLEYRKVEENAIVDCGDYCFGPFSVLILCESDGATSEKEYSFYLRHKKYCVVKYMFTCTAATLEEAASMGYSNAPEYISEFIHEMF